MDIDGSHGMFESRGGTEEEPDTATPSPRAVGQGWAKAGSWGRGRSPKGPRFGLGWGDLCCASEDESAGGPGQCALRQTPASWGAWWPVGGAAGGPWVTTLRVENAEQSPVGVSRAGASQPSRRLGPLREAGVAGMGAARAPWRSPESWSLASEGSAAPPCCPPHLTAAPV